MKSIALWLDIVAAVLTIILALYTLPKFVAGTWEKVRDWWSLRTHQKTVARLTELELNLKQLDEPPDMQYEVIQFMSVVVTTLTTGSCAAMAATFYFYGYYQAQLPSPVRDLTKFLVVAVVFFMIATLVGMWGMFHFTKMLKPQKAARRRELESSIDTMQKKLKVRVKISKDSSTGWK
jgi:hypothetical protein